MSPKSTNLVSPVSRSVRRKTNRYPVTTLSVVLLAIIGLAPAFAQRRITLSADFAETLAANPQSVQLLAQTHLTISGNLPSAVVQTTYTGSLSVSGAPAPYRFSIDQGSLPPGLLLGSSDGVISGTPTTAGTYNFHVSVWANNNTAHGDNWMAIHVNPAAVSITISPTTSTVTSGGSQQFAAFVRGTNQTAVSWSASAGQISSQGLFTAPSVSANALVTVTGTSVADATKHASAQVTVTAVQSSLSITTPSLPAAQLNTPYSATVSATGGKQPYSWSISGSLPSGLQLNASSGSISGSATGSGSFPVSMKVSDSSGQNAQQNFVIIVSSNSQCGPPQYSCSRSDTAVLVPGNPPQLGADPRYYGGHSGAAAIGVDPDYQNRILRVTDGNTDPTRPGMSFNTPASAEKNVTSFDETLFITHDEGNRLCLFQFDPAQFKSTYHGCFYNLGSGGGAEFGYTQADNRAIYNFSGRKLFRFIVDTTSWQVTPDANFNNGTGFVDLDSPTCLNGQITANKWSVHDHAMSSDDGTFIASVGPLQDQDPYFVVWNASKGCQWINVHTWQASRGWDTGQSNPINVVFKSGTVPVPKTSGGGHNAQIDRSGAFGVLAINGEAINHKVFWTIGTNVIDDTCTTCQSHWACDFGICFWDHGSSSNSGFAMSSQPIGSNSITLNMNNAAAATQWPADEHTSHANASPSSRTIYLVAWDRWKQQTTTQVWDSEITGVNWDGSMRTVRFNKHWNSGYGGFWASSRCPISRQGSYALCGSDYQLNNLDRGFGNGLNQDTCDHTLNAGVRGTNACRTDVLLFELR